MRLIFAILFLLSIDAFAVQKTPVVSGQWTSTVTWGAAVPTASDSVTITNTAITCSTTACVCKTLTTSSTTTLTIDGGARLSVSGDITFDGATALAGTGTLRSLETSTVTSNGAVLTTEFDISGQLRTWTFADDLYCAGFNALSNSQTINGNIIYTSGSFISSSNTLSGSTEITMTGTGSLQTASCPHKINIASTGTVTIGNVTATGMYLNYVSGTVITTGLLQATGSYTLNANGDSSPSATTTSTTGINFKDFKLSLNGGTLTLLSNVCVTDSLYGSSGNQTVNGDTIFANKSMAINSSTLLGTASIQLQGSGYINSTAQLTLSGGITINTSGTYIVLGTFRVKYLYYSSGSVNTSGSILNVITNGVYDTDGIIWDDVAHQAASGTYTLNSLLTASKYTIDTNPTWNGTAGFTVDTLTGLTTGDLTLEDGVEYTVNEYITTAGTSGNHGLIKSSDATVKTLLTLGATCTQALVYCDGTRVDSSNGKLVNAPGGVLTETINWGVLLGGNPIFID